MEISLKFSSLEEMNKFCYRQIQDKIKQREETFYQDIEVLKYFHEMNVKLNNYQWNWLPSFFSKGSYVLQGLSRQIGKTDFFMYLTSYIIKKEQKKVLYIGCNTNMCKDFMYKLNEFSPLKQEEYKLIYTTTKDFYDSLRGNNFAYAFYDEIPYDNYKKISNNLRESKELLLSSI